MSELNDMTCAELADVAAELALGVLTGRERAMAVAHLGGCEACREDVRQLMATGERLLELLPPAEPPAGFETRVLERLGLSASAKQDAYPRLIRATAHRRGTDRTGKPPARPGGARRTGRPRRALAATAMGLALIAAGLGGWRVGVGVGAPATSASANLATASLVSASHQNVGSIFLYSGTRRWLYMSVDLESGRETVTCEVVGTDGRVSKLGTFQLADGYGSWGSPDPGNVGTLSGARLLSANGTVLATATFTH